MKKTFAALLGLMAFCAFAGAASADGAPKARAPEPMGAGPMNWSGFYIGVNAGWANSDIDWRYTNPAPANCCAPFSADVDNGIFGAHAGVQHQWGNWVLGVEFAGSGTRLFDDDFSRKSGCITTFPAITCASRTDRLWTVGPRIGWAADRWLLFATGGYARGVIDSKLVLSTGGFDPTTRHHNGWFVGTGFEYALRDNLVFGLEYQHIDLDTERHLSSLDNFDPNGVNARDFGATVDLVRARLSFLFGREAPRAAPLK